MSAAVLNSIMATVPTTANGEVPAPYAAAEREARTSKHILNLLNNYRDDPKKMVSVEPLLPLMIKLEGKPMTLRDHFPFEPFFRTRLADVIQFKTGRQAGKSASLSARTIAMTNTIDNFSTLVVTPLFEQARRLSTMYFRPMLENSPVRSLFADSVNALKNVMHRIFRNGSQVIFSYAYLSADRNRGIFADQLVIDELQDMRHENISVLMECLSARKWKLRIETGTPKSMANTVQKEWNHSSQAEWVIKCRTAGCNYWNVASLHEDLLDMVGGRPRDDIGPGKPATSCAKCGKMIDPRWGHWHHFNKKLRWEHAGYHVPQILLPIHSENKKAWGMLLAKMGGAYGYDFNKFLNEVMGESTDDGMQVISESDLKRAACLPWKNVFEEAVKHTGDYAVRYMSVDWGGYGVKMTSFTVITIMAPNERGGMDILFSHRVNRINDFPYEAKLIAQFFKAFRCALLINDMNTIGMVRESMLRQVGMPASRILGSMNTGVQTREICHFHQPTTTYPYTYMSLHKTRSLAVTCDALRSCAIRTFQFDYESEERPGVLKDFEALIEERIERPSVGQVYTIIRDPDKPDDFAHTVNMGAWYHWRSTNRMPDLAAAARLTLPADILKHIEPEFTDIEWDEINDSRHFG